MINIASGSWGLIFLGFLYSLYLFRSIPNGVFFNGDASLKALLAKQFSQGQGRFDLIEKAEAWVQRLWQQGLYAYQAPFVYDLNQRYYVSFPFPFSLLTSFFYKFLGYRGFYVIPLLSTWLLWLGFYWISSLLDLGNLQIFLGLLILIFCSPLTLYSAMYWEHTLAATLSFVGIAITLFVPEILHVGFIQALLGGCIVGLSVWFRSECLALIAALGFMILLGLTPGQTLLWQINLKDFFALNTKYLVFMGGITFSVLLLWLCNQIIYKRFLGIHSLLILEEFSWSKRLKEAQNSFSQLNTSFLEYFPISIISLAYLLSLSLQNLFNILGNTQLIIVALLGALLIAIKKRKGLLNVFLFLALSSLFSQVYLTVGKGTIFIYALYFLYTLGVACLVDSVPGEVMVGGKQWGPRYLLPLIPFVTWLVVEQVQVLLNQSNPPLVIYGGTALLLTLLLLGIYKNIYQGTKYFHKNHQGIAEAMEMIKNDPNEIVAFSHQYATQVLGFGIKDHKTFFSVENSQQLQQLGQALIDQKLFRFLYVCYPYQSCKVLEEGTVSLQLEKDDQEWQINLKSSGIYGKYPIYTGVISPVGQQLLAAESVTSELLCTILPTYNERDNIGQLIRQLLTAVPCPYLIIVVDDNSLDKTWQLVEEIVQEYPLAPTDQNFEYGVILQRRINERGLTSALQTGIDEAINIHGAKIVTWMDCDLSMPPEDVPKLIKSMRERKADIAVGSRWVAGGDDIAHGMMARLLSLIINQMAVIMLGDAVHDYTSGFIAARSEVLKHIRLQGDYGEYCIDLLGRAARDGYKLVEVPYLCVPRISGESKTGINLWDYLDKGRNYVTTIWKLRGYNR